MHKFIIIGYDNIPMEIRYHLTESSFIIDKCEITDQFIVNNYQALSPKYAEFRTYWDKIGNKRMGLSYYGITIFVGAMLPEFLHALNSILPGEERNRLINLCKTAINNDLCILHFGI